MPRRIQRKRTKGWRMPEGVIYVGRPGAWGNPFGKDDASLMLYRNAVKGIWDPSLVFGLTLTVVREIYQKYEAFQNQFARHPLDVARGYLRGKDLACWCKEGAPCHADILLELANQ